mmetsp:Transcript_13222/g.20805  ORF Transcript_13222/g.20805 Transcript_13222/m.20805 type:complete len:192 (+) Transcript_13222:1312-1887(+)
MDEPKPDTNIDIPADLQDLDIDINPSLPIALQRLSVNPFNLLLNLVALVALVAQCAKFTFDAVLPNARAQRTCTFLFMVITIFVLLSLVPGAASINILNSIHFGPGDVGMAAAFGISSSCTNHYLVDSCCTTVIVCNNQYLHNILSMEPRSVRGLIGSKTYTMSGDLHLPLTTTDGHSTILVLLNVIYYPT